jgi:hypothetical protein
MWWEVFDALAAIHHLWVVAMIVVGVVNQADIVAELRVHLLRLQLFHLQHCCGKHLFGRCGCILDSSFKHGFVDQRA